MRMDLNTFLLLTAIGLTAGALSGFVGIGGGVVMVPALIYFLNFKTGKYVHPSMAQARWVST